MVEIEFGILDCWFYGLFYCKGWVARFHRSFDGDNGELLGFVAICGDC